MAYGRISARVTPTAAKVLPKAAAQIGLGKTSGPMLGSNSAKAPATKVSPAVQSQQDLAMAKALGLPGAKEAKLKSTGRQNVPVVKRKEASNAGAAPIPKVRSNSARSRQPTAVAGRAGKSPRS